VLKLCESVLSGVGVPVPGAQRGEASLRPMSRLLDWIAYRGGWVPVTALSLLGIVALRWWS